MKVAESEEEEAGRAIAGEKCRIVEVLTVSMTIISGKGSRNLEGRLLQLGALGAKGRRGKGSMVTKGWFR